MTESDLMTLPISPQVFWGLIWMLGLLTACVVIYVALPTTKQSDTAWVRYKRYTGLIKVPEPLPELILLIWITILALLIAGLGWTIAKTAFGVIPKGETATTVLFRLAGLTGVTGAVVAFPFTILRTQYNKRQTDAAEKALVNDKLNAAFAGLSARRTVTSRFTEFVYQHGKAEITTLRRPEVLFEIPVGAELIRRESHQVISEEEDDIVTRSTAIDRLEGLAVEQPDQAARIVSILSLYVREISRIFPPEEMPFLDDETDDVRKWAHSLQQIRPDIEKAAQTLGRLPELVPGYDSTNSTVDLRGSNLQRCDLSGLNFENARMDYAHLQGADLAHTRLNKANLFEAKLAGAHLVSAELKDAQLSGAQLIGAYLDYADLSGADLFQASAWGAQMHKTKFNGASIFACNLYDAQTDSPPITAEQMSEALGDVSTLINSDHYPSHWPQFKVLDYSREWARFKQNPTAYTPPDPLEDAPET